MDINRIPYNELSDSSTISNEINYISGESKEISMISVFNLIILILFVIYLLIWGIYNYIYKKVVISNIVLGE